MPHVEMWIDFDCPPQESYRLWNMPSLAFNHPCVKIKQGIMRSQPPRRHAGGGRFVVLLILVERPGEGVHRLDVLAIGRFLTSQLQCFLQFQVMIGPEEHQQPSRPNVACPPCRLIDSPAVEDRSIR